MGTAILVLLGTAVVANVNLSASGMKGAGAVQITFGWGLAVMIPAFIFGSTSGAHMNPALTLALALDGSTSWGDVPLYISGQFAGAFLGGALTWLLFKAHLDNESNPEVKFAVFGTRPSIPSPFLNFMSELVGTFILVFAIKGIARVDGIAGGLGNFFVFAIILSIGMSLGGLTGYAINPARDFGPRLVHAIMPIRGKGSSNWKYAWIPFCAPVVGGALAAWVYSIIPWPPAA